MLKTWRFPLQNYKLHVVIGVYFLQIKDTKIDFFPQETALCFEPEEDNTQMKLGLITRRLETIEQIFKTKVCANSCTLLIAQRIIVVLSAGGEQAH